MDVPANTEPSVSAPDVVWRNGRFGQTSRRDTLVASPLLVFLGIRRVSGLRQLGRVSERALHLRSLYLSVLFA